MPPHAGLRRRLPAPGCNGRVTPRGSGRDGWARLGGEPVGCAASRSPEGRRAGGPRPCGAGSGAEAASGPLRPAPGAASGRPAPPHPEATSTSRTPRSRSVRETEARGVGMTCPSSYHVGGWWPRRGLPPPSPRPGHPERGPECCRPGAPDPPSHLVELEPLREKRRVGVGPAARLSRHLREKLGRGGGGAGSRSRRPAGRRSCCSVVSRFQS